MRAIAWISVAILPLLIVGAVYAAAFSMWAGGGPPQAPEVRHAHSAQANLWLAVTAALLVSWTAGLIVAIKARF